MTYLAKLQLIAAVLMIGLFLSGCEALRKPYPDRAMYGVSIEVPEDTKPGEGRGILKVSRIRVVAPYDDRTFFYKVGPSEFKADYYNTFFAPPDRMFTFLLHDYLQGVGGFDTFLPPFSGADYNLRLEGNIRALYADFTEGPIPYAVIEARFFLISEDLTKDGIMAQRFYSQRVKAESAEPEAIVRAWGEALVAMYAELASDITEAIEPGTYETSPEADPDPDPEADPEAEDDDSEAETD